MDRLTPGKMMSLHGDVRVTATVVSAGGVRLRSSYLFRYTIARSARITKDKIVITKRRTIERKFGATLPYVLRK